METRTEDCSVDSDQSWTFLAFGPLFILASFQVFGLAKHVGKNFHLIRKINKNLNITNIKIGEIPESVKNISHVPKKLSKLGIKKEASDCINQFINELSKNPNFDYRFLNNNFRPFGVTEKKVVNEKEKTVMGNYNGIINQITVKTGRIREYIFHELLHEASSYFEGSIWICGFERIKFLNNGNTEYDIGKGLNEAYTDLLNKRYFSQYGAKTGYEFLIPIAKLFEEIIGKNMMEYLYFRGDLKALIEEMRGYAIEKEVIILLRQIDKTFELIYKSKDDYIVNRLAERSYRKSLISLVRIAFKKIAHDYNIGNRDLKKTLSLFRVLDETINNTVYNKDLSCGLKNSEASELSELLEELKYGIFDPKEAAKGNMVYRSDISSIDII